MCNIIEGVCLSPFGALLLIHSVGAPLEKVLQSVFGCGSYTHSLYPSQNGGNCDPDQIQDDHTDPYKDTHPHHLIDILCAFALGFYYNRACLLRELILADYPHYTTNPLLRGHHSTGLPQKC